MSIENRPRGLKLTVALVALNGAASLFGAAQLAASTQMASFHNGQSTAAILGSLISAALGLALLHRAYALWNLKLSAYLVTLALLSVRTLLAVLAIAGGLTAPLDWAMLVVAAAGVLYLIQPGVRALFLENPAQR